MLASLRMEIKMLGRKRRAGAAGAPLAAGTAPRWLVARAARYRAKFPYSNYYDVPFRRGSPESLEAVGPTYRQATPEQRMTRRDIMMTGRGLYRGRGGFFGRAIGNLFGMGDLGDKLGDAAWSVGKSLLPQPVQDIGSAVFGVTDKLGGRGLYRGRGIYAANNLVIDDGAKASNVVPQFHPSDLHTIKYSNREYVRDIFAPATNTVFELQSWELNPGLPTSFPWLSQLAINFEEYELVQLAYTFKSTISDFAASSGQVGQVLMCTQYNPDSGPFATKDEMMLYEGGMSCKTTESMIHGVECDPKKIAGSAQKYVRAGSIPPQEDLKNYDLGRTSLAVVNAPSTYANQQIGELWVSYTIILRKPKIASGNAYNVRRDIFISPPFNVGGNAKMTSEAALLSGSRNSLGCEVKIAAVITNGTTTVALPTGPGTDDLNKETPEDYSASTNTKEQFRIIIPSDFSGVLKLRLIVQSNQQNTQFWQAVSLAPSTISRFSDIAQMIPASSTREWSHILNTKNDSELSSGATYMSDMTLHIRVQPPSNGAPNIVAFGLPANSGALINGGYTFWSLEISQYNTFLSVQDNGKNDRVDLIQLFSGQPALYT